MTAALVLDPTHPAEVAALYAEHVPNCTVREAPIPEVAGVIGEFCDGLAAW